MEVEWNEPQLDSKRGILPLFRDKDVQSMSAKFDLSAYDDVKANADKILDKLADGLMRCDGPWPEDYVAVFRQWVDAGYPA